MIDPLTGTHDQALLDPVAAWARRSPEATAIIDADRSERWSYRELDDRAGRWVRWLTQAGVRAGDRIGLLSHNSPDHFALFVACCRARVALLPISWRLTATERDRLLSLAPVRLLLVAPECGAATDGQGAADRVRMQDIRLPAMAMTTTSPLDPSQVVMVLFTSGSSGEPRGVCLSLGQLAANAAATVAGWRLSGADVGAISTPLFHTSGWHSLATPLLSVGGSLLLTRRFDAAQLTPLLASHRCTVGFVVPTQLTMWSKADSFGDPIPTLRWMLVGGAALPQQVAAQARGLGYLVRDAYGLTEFGPNCFGWGHDDATPIEAVGRPLPLLEWRLLGETGEVGGHAPEEGELWLRGPQAPAGFLDPGGHQRVEGGWIRTGDLLRRSDDGTFSVLGRLSDRYISGGETIHPTEVEQVLSDYVGVAEVAVVPLADPLWGEVGCAVVRPTAQATSISLAEMRAHARGRLAGYKLPRALLLLDELPRLGSGKIDRASLRVQLRERTPERLAG